MDRAEKMCRRDPRGGNVDTTLRPRVCGDSARTAQSGKSPQVCSNDTPCPEVLSQTQSDERLHTYVVVVVVVMVVRRGGSDCSGGVPITAMFVSETNTCICQYILHTLLN